MAKSTKKSNYFWNFSDHSLDLFANSFFFIARKAEISPGMWLVTGGIESMYSAIETDPKGITIIRNPDCFSIMVQNELSNARIRDASLG